MRLLSPILTASTALSAALLALLVAAILTDFTARHLGLSVVIGLERVEYLLLATVLAALPNLSRSGGHIALAWGGAPSRLRSRLIAGVTAGLCLAFGIRYAGLAFEAWQTGAHFRRGLDVPEAPVWAAASLAFSLAGLATLARIRA